MESANCDVLVQSLPLGSARWLVVVVALYTAATMRRSSLTEGAATSAALLVCENS